MSLSSWSSFAAQSALGREALKQEHPHGFVTSARDRPSPHGAPAKRRAPLDALGATPVALVIRRRLYRSVLGGLRWRRER